MKRFGPGSDSFDRERSLVVQVQREVIKFLNSLDALYKQIVPKLHEMGYSVSLSSVQLQGRGDRVYQAHLFKTYHDEALADSEEPARALAESILRMLEDQE